MCVQEMDRSKQAAGVALKSLPTTEAETEGK